MSRLVKVIPCLDVKDGRVVKGVKFENLRDAGDPAQLAGLYSVSGADEVAILDLSASNEGRATMLSVVEAAAEACRVGLTVGGGISSVEQVAKILDLGASKVSVSTAAVTNPDLINAISDRFGSDVLMLSLDARKASPESDFEYEVTTHGGTRGAGMDVRAWVAEAEKRGVGEILVNSIDQDGVQSGFDLDLIRTVRETVKVPIIASGGAGSIEDFVAGADAGADAVLGASVFHFGIVEIRDVKDALVESGYRVEQSQ